MTTVELCEATGLSRGTLQKWLECGLLQAENKGITGGGVRRQFSSGSLERVQLILTLQGKGLNLGQLAGRDLNFPGERFLVFDDRELHGCRDAETAIARVVRAKRACAAVDLATIRRA